MKRRDTKLGIMLSVNGVTDGANLLCSVFILFTYSCCKITVVLPALLVFSVCLYPIYLEGTELMKSRGLGLLVFNTFSTI